jgi:hypothetical protein
MVDGAVYVKFTFPVESVVQATGVPVILVAPPHSEGTCTVTESPETDTVVDT